MKTSKRFIVEWNDQKVAQETSSPGLRSVKTAKELRAAGLKGGVIVSLSVFEGDKFIQTRQTTVTRVLEVMDKAEGGA